MKTPRGLQPLIEDGLVDEVLRQLQSGKEADVYVVACGPHIRCAKVYKDAIHRGFKKAAAYQESRKTRRSRDARAMQRGSRRGRKVQEAEWKSAEVDALYRLHDAGVRVPKPHVAYEGVLLMELLLDADGQPAPRLNEVEMTAEQARDWHTFMIRQIVLMLCAGWIHGDLSEFNVLVDADGPVVIDLPQAVNASGNNQAFEMLARDVNNMRRTFAAVAPELANTDYALEIWALYEASQLKPDSKLTGQFQRSTKAADVDAVIDEIEDARLTHEARERGRVAAEQLDAE